MEDRIECLIMRGIPRTGENHSWPRLEQTCHPFGVFVSSGNRCSTNISPLRGYYNCNVFSFPQTCHIIGIPVLMLRSVLQICHTFGVLVLPGDVVLQTYHPFGVLLCYWGRRTTNMSSLRDFHIFTGRSFRKHGNACIAMTCYYDMNKTDRYAAEISYRNSCLLLLR
jgi:hypothetical protein